MKKKRVKNKRFLGWLGTLLISIFLLGNVSPQTPTTGQSFDLILRGGWVLDGSGNPAFRADVALRDSRIVAVGRLTDAAAASSIDVTGKWVLPGFIDLHSHADGPLRQRNGLRSSDPARRAAPNLVSQGITTVVVNQDGRSPWPISAQKQEIQQLGIGPNTALLIGHGSIRAQVMGSDFQRQATSEEVERMAELVRQGMQEGAYGLSAGLEYQPGRWSQTSEVVGLVREIVPFGGVYISHQRSEGATPMWYFPSRLQPVETLLDSVVETIQIGEETGAVVVASHIKAKGENYWGSSMAAVRLIEGARKRGVEIWADQYPYDTTGSDGNTVLIPRWVFQRETAQERFNFRAALEKTLTEVSQERLRLDVKHEISRRGGAQRIIIFDYPDKKLIGRSLLEVARLWDVDPVEAALRLQLQGYESRPGGARLRGFSLAEEDIVLYASQPWTATASDAGIALPGDGPVHARFYGTFPRKIRRYALEKGVISVGDAVRSMTSLPAQILGLRDRGMVREGMWADLVVADPETLSDQATFFEPHQYARGIEQVLVNGEFVVRDGTLTGALPGVVLQPRNSR